MATLGRLPGAPGVKCVSARWRVTQRAKSGDGFFACIMTAVKPKSITMEKNKNNNQGHSS